MLELYAHPFSSYCWKVLIALYERDIPFEYRMLDGDHPENFARLKEAWPVGKFPVLIIDGAPVIESSIIIETLDDARFGTAPLLIPENPIAALDVRFMDRVFDNHVMGRMQAVVDDYIADGPNASGPRIDKAKAALDTIYDWLESRLGEDGWACGEHFTLADCAAAPSLLCRLGAGDWRGAAQAQGLSCAAARAAFGEPLRRGCAALPRLFPARRPQ